MANEPSGPGYVAPPTPPETSIIAEERVRSVEDFLSRRIKCRVYRTTSQAGGPGIAHTLSWQAEEYDTSGMWGSGTTLTVPAGAEGDYLLIGQLTMNPTSDGVYAQVATGIYINGLLVVQQYGNVSASCSVDRTLYTGDQITMKYEYGISGISLSQSAQAGLNSTFLSIRRLT